MSFLTKFFTPEKGIKEATDNQKIIAEIHRTFDSAGDYAVHCANEILNQLPSIDQEKVSKLKALGFNNASVVKQHEETKKKELANKATLQTVQKWKVKYPLYKFITEAQVTDICEKYGLVCGHVDLYKGDVPKKNITEIENFRVDNHDASWQYCYTSDSIRNRSWYKSTYRDYLDYEEEHSAPKQKGESIYHTEYSGLRGFKKDKEYRREPLYICAPISDMDTTGMRVNEDGFLVKDDPIVLQKMQGGGFLIVSKWGLEASDPQLTNPIEN